jgi:hypothetical protein
MSHRVLLALLAATTVGCGSGKTPGQLNAEAIAHKWVEENDQRSANRATYLAVPVKDGWQVEIEFQPATPGAHILIHVNAQNKVTEVVPGA